MTAELKRELTAQLTVVTEVRQELEGNTERFEQLGSQINSGFEAVLEELGLTQVMIRNIITEMWADWQALLAEVKEQVEVGFAQSSQENQKIQETLETGFERVISYLT